MNKDLNPEGNRQRAPKNTNPTGRNGSRPADDAEESNDESKEDSGLRELLIDEMADVLHAEKQLLKALPKMAKAAQSEALTEAFESHLAETEQQIARLEQAFTILDEKVKSKTCKAMKGLLEEGTEMLEEHKGEPTIDAALIAAAQKVEHYEIASYGTLCAWAKQLGEEEAAELFGETLQEEKAADEKLTGIAEETANTHAEEAD